MQEKPRGKVTQQNNPFLEGVPNCYFGALGDCLLLVTGAWYTKPCTHTPALIVVPVSLLKAAHEAWPGGLMVT